MTNEKVLPFARTCSSSHRLANFDPTSLCYSGKDMASDCSLNRLAQADGLFSTLSTRNSDHCFVTSSGWSDDLPDEYYPRNEMSSSSSTTPSSSNPLFRFSLPRVSLAKLSVVFLALATLTDMALTTVQNQPNTRAVSLGSAAISSVTDTLSPILPFAGGLDLRRADYWSTNNETSWFAALQSVVGQVQDAFAQQRDATDDEDNIETSKNTTLKKNKQKHRIVNTAGESSHAMAISVTKPFVSTDVISQLSLGQVAQVFRYAVESSNPDFNESKFLQQIEARVRTVIVAMKGAVTKSGGKEFAEWKRSSVSDGDSNDMDALKFAASMRVLAEWRLLRLNPDGYKGFAVGMSLGHKDVVQNLVKMEEAIHSVLDTGRRVIEEGDDVEELCTPTLRELLRFEADTGVHPLNKLPRLKEKSAAMGLLWVRRQLEYQTHLFDNVMNIDRFDSTKDAVHAAYKQVYDRYHGWAVQKIFSYSFQSAPNNEVIFRQMNSVRLQELLEQESRNDPNKDSDRIYRSKKEENENAIEQFLNHVGNEWDKLASNVVKIFKKPSDEEQRAEAAVRGYAAGHARSHNDFVTQEMVKDAHEQITAYLTVAHPILHRLAELFDDLNMDDPTRV
jgi:Glycolipid transfer protein (GLTP)